MNKIYVTGDLHGQSLSFWYRTKDLEPGGSLILLGDVGLRYGGRTQTNLRDAMHKFDGTIYIMRGNHDCRYVRDITGLHETYLGQVPNVENDWITENNLTYNKKYDNIKYINDAGGLVQIGLYNILFIPGAYSIDKDWRFMVNAPYELQEQLTWAEQNMLLTVAEEYKNDIDFVCSHTAPMYMQPYFKDLFLSSIDQSKVDSNMEYFLNEIYHIVGKNVKRWYFGHYHDNRDVSTNFTMLYNKIVELGETVNGG